MHRMKTVERKCGRGVRGTPRAVAASRRSLHYDGRNMGIVPKPTAKRIAFYRTRIAKFEQNAEAIGTTPEAVADLDAKLVVARDALSHQRKAQNAARSATLRLRLAMDEVTNAGAAIISQVRTKARMTGNPGVYSLASLPPIAERSPMAEPGTPTAFSFTLESDGLLLLKWQCKNPRGSSGTMYHVFRSIGANSPLIFLGATGSKAFLDSTIPPGTSAITYRVQAFRSTKVGVANNFIVTFGRSTAGDDVIPLPTLLPRKKAFIRAA